MSGEFPPISYALKFHLQLAVLTVDMGPNVEPTLANSDAGKAVTEATVRHSVVTATLPEALATNLGGG